MGVVTTWSRGRHPHTCSDAWELLMGSAAQAGTMSTYLPTFSAPPIKFHIPEQSLESPYKPDPIAFPLLLLLVAATMPVIAVEENKTTHLTAARW